MDLFPIAAVAAKKKDKQERRAHQREHSISPATEKHNLKGWSVMQAGDGG